MTIGLMFGSVHEAQQAAIGTLPGMAKDALPDGTERDFIIIVRDGDGPLLRASLSLRVETLK